MPTFSNSLPAKTERRGYDLKRTPPDKPIKGLITCDDLIGCNTHWWGGRTVPCEDDGCEACKANTPSRWHCYLSIYEGGSKDHFIFECTGKAAIPLIEWRKTNGTLRGVHITATRPKRRRNARVDIILRPFDTTNIMLPKAPDLVRAMGVIWQLPQSSLRIEDALQETPRVRTNSDVLNRQRHNEADGTGKPHSTQEAEACFA